MNSVKSVIPSSSDNVKCEASKKGQPTLGGCIKYVLHSGQSLSASIFRTCFESDETSIGGEL